MSQREQWSSRLGFLFATLGSAIGLGNLWRFPYMAGDNGGGAFVIVYFLFAFVICAPPIMAELAMGKKRAATLQENGWAISAASPRPQEAWRLLRFLARKAEPCR